MAHIRLESPKDGSTKTDDLFKLIDGSASSPSNSAEKKGLFASFWKKPMIGKGGVRREFEHQALAGPSYSAESEATESETNTGGDAEDAWNMESRDEEVWGLVDVETPREDHSKPSVRDDTGFPPLPPGSASKSSARTKMKATPMGKGRHLNPKVLLARTAKKKENDHKPKDFSLMQMISQSFDSESGMEVAGHRDFVAHQDARDMYPVNDDSLPVHPPPTAYAQIDLSGEITKVVPEHGHFHDYLSPVPTSSDESDQLVEQQQSEADFESIPSGDSDPYASGHDGPSASGNDSPSPSGDEGEIATVPSTEIDDVVPSFKDRLAFYKTQSNGKFEPSYHKPTSIETSYPKPVSIDTVKGKKPMVSLSTTPTDNIQESRPGIIGSGEKHAPNQNESIQPNPVDEGSSLPVTNRIKRFQANVTTATTSSSMGLNISETARNGAPSGKAVSNVQQRLVPVQGRSTDGKPICILVPDFNDNTAHTSPLYCAARVSAPSTFQVALAKEQILGGGNEKLPSPSQSVAGVNSQPALENPDTSSATMTLAQRKAAFLSSGRLSESNIDTQRKESETLATEVTKRPPPHTSRQSMIELTTTNTAKHDEKKPIRPWAKPKNETVQNAKGPKNLVPVAAKNPLADDTVSKSSHSRVIALRSSIENTRASGNFITNAAASNVRLDTSKVPTDDSGSRAEGRFGLVPAEKRVETTLQDQANCQPVETGAMSISDRKKAFTANFGKGPDANMPKDGNETQVAKLKNTRQSFQNEPQVAALHNIQQSFQAKQSVVITAEQLVGTGFNQHKVLTKVSSTIPSKTSATGEPQDLNYRIPGVHNKAKPQNGVRNPSTGRSWRSSTSQGPPSEESDLAGHSQHQTSVTVSVASRKKAFISNLQRTSKSGSSLFVDIDMRSSSTDSVSDSARLAAPSDEYSDPRTMQEESETLPLSVQRQFSTSSEMKAPAFDAEERFLSLAERKRVLALTAKGNEVSRRESKESDDVPQLRSNANVVPALKSTGLDKNEIDAEPTVEEPKGNDDPPKSLADRMRNLRNSFQPQQPNFATNTNVNTVTKRSWSIVGATAASSTRDERNDESKRIEPEELPTVGKGVVIDNDPPYETTSKVNTIPKAPVAGKASKSNHVQKSWIKEVQATDAQHDDITGETEKNMSKRSPCPITPPLPKEKSKSIADLTKAFESGAASGTVSNGYTNPASTTQQTNCNRGSPTKSPQKSGGQFVARPETADDVNYPNQSQENVRASQVGEGGGPMKTKRNFASSRQFFESRKHPMDETLPVHEQNLSDEQSATSTKDESSNGIFGTGEHPLYVVVDGSYNASECLSPSPRMLDRKVVEPGSGMSYFEQLHAHASVQSPSREGPSYDNRSDENYSSPMPVWCRNVSTEKEVTTGDTTTTVEKYHAVKCKFSQKALPWRQKSAADRYLERKRHTMSTTMMQTPELGLEVVSSYPVKTRTSDLFCPIFNESFVAPDDKAMVGPNATPSRDHPPPASFRSPFGTPINGYNYGNSYTPK